MEQNETARRLTDLIARFIDYSGKHLPDDVTAKLRELSAREQTDMARLFYDAMFEDLRLADALSRPCCQDTGVIQFFVRVGTCFPMIDELETCLREAVKRATATAPLRPNAVEVFDEKNTGDNTGTHIPWIDWELAPGSEEATVFLYMAGGGCSLPGAAKVLMPAQGYEGVVRFVLEQITTLGVNACPPLLVGVGIGGSAEVAAKLSKKALLRPIGSQNAHPRGAALERLLEEGLNEIGIGPGGITGRTSVMGVQIEQASRHPATLAVGLSTGCWAHRRAGLKIGADLSGTMLSYEGVTL